MDKSKKISIVFTVLFVVLVGLGVFSIIEHIKEINGLVHLMSLEPYKNFAEIVNQYKKSIFLESLQLIFTLVSTVYFSYKAYFCLKIFIKN